jgi:hypothetical protein
VCCFVFVCVAQDLVGIETVVINQNWVSVMQTHSIQQTTSQQVAINNGSTLGSVMSPILYEKTVVSESAEVAVNPGGPLFDYAGSPCY